MELILKVISGKQAGQKLKVPSPKFLIGRGGDCHLQPKSDLVSRHHCVLLIGTSSAVIRDLGSRDGTFVNEERIAGDRPLRPGDRLTIGPLKFEVEVKQSDLTAPPVVAGKEAAATVATDRDDLDVLELLTEDSGRSIHDTLPMGTSETMTTPQAPLPGHDVPPALPAVNDHSPTESRPSRPARQDKDGGEAATRALHQFFKRR